jgi:hypothetical protein
MLIIDSLLMSGIRFVLDQVAAAVDTQLTDDGVLRERLLDAQMRVEIGELNQVEYEALEADILARLRDLKQRRAGEAAAISAGDTGDMTITGIEATLEGDQH